ncbi:M56 family metallopeptidase [Lutibacter flavus]|uniref:Signal transducer regulating beta-lactamase production, contains metallopeptidase domain n=1 Tax=Lutibacter flavus TaxID=691689 RepID=A0A238ZHC1_9FLAO|nr:M56 family metallopeptidase [Lutibacter flavus]SNR82441.1 Signal transducer regulating beta-lactamase production, contains metallopeptidase domain [Lutibacter flavus]
MINYIIQVLLFQALFLTVYDFFLQKETFFKWNRIYLLITPFLAFIIPLLRFESIQKSIPQEFVVQLPTVFLNPQAIIEQNTANSSTIDYLSIAFYFGLTIFSLLFLTRLFKILKLIYSNEVIKKENFNLVLLAKSQSAFSFFNYIFINKQLLENEELEIIRHELVHCKQKHTIDLLVFELLKIVLWFNPLVYVYQKRITLLHEYISDAEVVKETNKSTYFNKLLSETFNVEKISFINQFFKQSLIKKRIVMIAKEKSQKIKQLKYLLVIPLLVAMLIYSSCTDEVNDELFEMETVLNNQKDFSKGQYFDFEIGKTFVGNSLMIGRYLDISEYTAKEKEISDKFNSNDELLFDHVVLLDENDIRVNWFRPKSLRLGLKSEWEYIEGESVPFAKVENVPVFPGCEGTEEELRQCLQNEVTQHVNINFNAKMADGLGLRSGVKRIFVMFKIDKEGNIVEVQARAPHKDLQEEAIRVVQSLPKMEPGKYLGENVGVKYSLPIAFKVEDKKDNKVKKEVSNGNPLYILDGKEISKEDMEKINPDNIKSVNVLKDESATTKYGEKGKNGVVEIIIKK